MYCRKDEKVFFLKKIYTKVCFLLCITVFHDAIFSQSTIIDSTKKDSAALSTDTLILKKANSDIKTKIIYKADDSIIYDVRTRKMYLYNNSKIDYDDIHIDAYYIEYDWTSGNLEANQKKISEDSILGKPYLKQADKDYYTEKLRYNFKSQRGKVYDIITQEGEGILHGHEVKKDSIANWFVSKAKYTTCDLEHPHFYLSAKKLKLIPGKSIITGPTNLMINDIPTPLYLPFGIFPLKKGRRSGLILPLNYGFSPVFNMQKLGVYIGLNDYMDATFSTDIYLNGSYAFYSHFNYNKKYKYNGNFGFETTRIFLNKDADNPAERASVPQSYRVFWTHNQDIKAHPTFNFKSSLDFTTASYFTNSLVVDDRRYTGNRTSNLIINKRFRNSPFQITGSLGYNQDLANQVVSGDLPSITLSYNGNPFKIQNSKSIWNQLNLNYSTRAIANISSLPDSLFFTSQLFDKLRYGVSNTASLNLGGLKLFKNLNITPNFNYTDRAYFKKTTIFKNASGTLDTSISKNLYTVRDFNGGVNLSTTIVGMFLFKGNKAIRGIKHLFIPTLGFSFAPNFNTDFWNYYQSYQDENNNKITYYPYHSLLSSPSTTATSILNFGVRNSFEGKFKSKKDSINGSIKKMILDNLSLGGSYNFAVDSFNLTNLIMSFSNSTLQFLTFSGGLTLDPYQYSLGKRTKEYRGLDNNFVKMTNLNTTISLNLSSNNFSKNALSSSRGTIVERQYIYNNYYYFYDFNSPWNVQLSFSTNLQNTYGKLLQDTSILTASLYLTNFDFNLTKNWKIAVSSGYDFNTNQITLTNISAIRRMHCWEFRIKYTPISAFGQAYSIEISPIAPLLRDLKLSRNKPLLDNYF